MIKRTINQTWNELKSGNYYAAFNRLGKIAGGVALGFGVGSAVSTTAGIATEALAATGAIEEESAASSVIVAPLENGEYLPDNPTPPVDYDPKAPVGRSGNPMKIVSPNQPTTINGYTFTGHSLDRMQGRGLISPTAIIDVVENPTTSSVGNTPGTMVYFKDGLKVVTDATGKRIITVMESKKP